MTDYRHLALGKKQGVVHDPHSWKMASLLPSGLPPVQKSWRIATQKHNWPMLGNDKYGDCVFVTHAHRSLAEEWSSRTKEKKEITTSEVLDFYSAVTGFRKDDPSTDNGSYLIDGMRYAHNVGFGSEADGTKHTVYAYALVADSSGDEFKQAARLFGGLHLGLALPWRASNQVIWDVPAQKHQTADDEPYSWGGHSCYLAAYDPSGVTIITWGEEKRATWPWLLKYCDERWATVSEDFFNKLGLTPQKLKRDKLETLLTAMR